MPGSNVDIRDSDGPAQPSTVIMPKDFDRSGICSFMCHHPYTAAPITSSGQHTVADWSARPVSYSKETPWPGKECACLEPSASLQVRQ